MLRQLLPSFLRGPIPIPPAEFRALVNGGPISEEDHVRIGRALFDMVRHHCQIMPSSTVLDIGCGCGRIAQPMAPYLTKGAYHGVDIVKPMVDWCQREIGGRYKNFHFHHAELSNTLYSDTGQSAANYVFPFGDEAFGAIFATSVFTHLVKDSAQQYLNEIARVLKPAGFAFLSFFLLSRNRPKRTRNGNLHQCDGYSVIDKANPEHIVVYEEAIARKMIEAARLRVRNTNLARPSDDPEDWSQQDEFVVSI